MKLYIIRIMGKAVAQNYFKSEDQARTWAEMTMGRRAYPGTTTAVNGSIIIDLK